jgi:hypothetical protein
LNYKKGSSGQKKSPQTEEKKSFFFSISIFPSGATAAGEQVDQMSL